MQIFMKSGISGAQEARGLGVIIDVFRGSTTVAALFARGASCVFPVTSLSEARQMKRRCPEYFLVGESKGKTPNGFDCGNSPFEVSRLDLTGRTIVFRSSAASRGIIEACRHSEVSELLIGSLANASSIVNYIREEKPKEVTLIAIGTLGFGPWRKAAEDEYCALYLKNLIERKQADFLKIKSEILKEEGAARLISLNQTRDLEICLNLDLFNGIIPKVKRSESEKQVKILNSA